MTLTPKHKLLIAVVALGAVCVGVDRFVLSGGGGPAQAGAALVPSALDAKAAELSPESPEPSRQSLRNTGTGVTSAPGALSEAASGRGSVERVQVRLAALGQRSLAEHQRAPSIPTSGFAAPQSWLEKITPEVLASASGPTKRSVTPKNDPRPALRLTAVSCREGVAVSAVINGMSVPVGGTIDGYRLVSLSASRASTTSASGSRAAGRSGGLPEPATAVLAGPSGNLELVLDPVGTR